MVTSRLPDPSRYLVGGDPPAVVVPARIARFLDRGVLERLRMEYRGSDGELDAVLSALHLAGLAYLEHGPTSASGTAEAEVTPEMSSSASGERMGSAEAANLLGCSDRWVRGLAPELDGCKVAGRWSYDREAVVEYAARRAS